MSIRDLVRHDRYSQLLVVATPIFLFVALLNYRQYESLVGTGVEQGPSSEALTFLVHAFASAVLVPIALLVMILRLGAYDAARAVTKAANVFFLLNPPLGTALGIYGLWKVDRGPSIEKRSSPSTLSSVETPVQPVASHRHDRYSRVLSVMIPVFLFAGIDYQLVNDILQWSSAGGTIASNPDPVRTTLSALTSIYLICSGLAIVTTVMRRYDHPAIPLVTKCVNVVFLAATPIGTIFGIYGLFRADKK